MKKYIQERRQLIDEIINLVKIVYPKDNKMLSLAVETTTRLMVAKPDQKFVDGMRGFIFWASAQGNKVTNGEVLTTLLHDLREFEYNRDELWFSPRTSRYTS